MRMQCKCGEILSNSMAPNDIQLEYILIGNGMI